MLKKELIKNHIKKEELPIFGEIAKHCEQLGIKEEELTILYSATEEKMLFEVYNSNKVLIDFTLLEGTDNFIYNSTRLPNFNFSNANSDLNLAIDIIHNKILRGDLYFINGYIEII